jgi:predicted N-acyltransferase
MLREGVQFHWENAGYADFEAFLASLKMDKRKKLRQDQRRVAQAGIHFSICAATPSAPTCWPSSTAARGTYRAHSRPYLTLDFFQRLLRAQPDSLLLIIALRGEQPVAAALNLIGGDIMYGRYWGTEEYLSGLHFETCYMQSIAYCIAHGLSC